MNREELRLEIIKNLTEYIGSNRDRKEPIMYVKDTISNIIADLANISTLKNAIVLNSNYGEISSKLSEVEKLVNIEIKADKIEIAKTLNPELTFINSDPLEYSLSDKFDLVVTFPLLRRRLESKWLPSKIQKLYIEKALNLLNENGTAIFILSNNFLTAPAFVEQRNLILNNFGISKILLIPIRTIINTGELCMLVVSKSNVLKTDYYTVNNDFSLKKEEPIFSVPKEKLTERWNLNYHNPQNKRYLEQVKVNESQKMGDLVDILFGSVFSEDEWKPKGTYKIISSKNIVNGLLEETTRDNFIERDNFTIMEQRSILQKGDIIFPMNDQEKVSIYIHNSDDNKYIANQNIVILRGKNAEYLATYLTKDSGFDLFNQQIKRFSRYGGAITTQDLKNILIPILPITE